MPFQFDPISTIPDLIVITPQVFTDSRGVFSETYQKSSFEKAGIFGSFVQDNYSISQKGVLRGIHYQKAPFSQHKLVRVSQGSVWDVAVDLRPSSKTYLQWFGLELSAENQKILSIPAGFGHGFLALEEHTHLSYKCSAEYSRTHEEGIRWNDTTLKIEWPRLSIPYIISEKDLQLASLTELGHQ